MSWFARSIANSLKFDDDDDVDAAQKPEPKQPENTESNDEEASSPISPSRGVKEDLSEISKTLSRQFWGVASFLAPPPQSERKPEPDVSESDQDSLLGIRSDFAEIGGRFRSGISRLSNNINVPNIKVSEFTKLASNFLQLESDDENEEGRRELFDSLGKGAVGVTEEVVAFARDVAMHPETWLDFPLPENFVDDDFDISDAQQEHALAVEQLAPRLAALRMELCPAYMSESCFWKIYFVLVHPRLDKQAAELLSTPQIVEARSSLAYELKKRNTNKPEDISVEKSLDQEKNAVSNHEEPLAVPSPVVSQNERDNPSAVDIGTSSEIVKHSVEENEIQVVDKSVIEEKDSQPTVSMNVFSEKDDDDADDWLKEETGEIGAAAVGKTIPIENEDDVSFSDLEEEEDGDAPSTYRKSNYSSDKDSRDWVRLGKSSDKENANEQENKETNDWLDIDDDIVVT